MTGSDDDRARELAEEAASLRFDIRKTLERLEKLRQRLENPELTEDRREVIERDIRFATGRLERLTGRLAFTDYASVQRIVVTGGGNVTVNSGSNVQSVQGALVRTAQIEADPPTLAERRQQWHFSYLDRVLRHYTAVFWVGLFFLVCGGVLAVSNLVYGIVEPQHLADRAVQGSIGILLGGIGGLMDRKAREKEKQLAEEAAKNAEKVDEDDQYGKTNARIDRVQDPDMRDRLNAAATMAELGFQADADILSARVIGPPGSVTELPPASDSTREDENPENLT